MPTRRTLVLGSGATLLASLSAGCAGLAPIRRGEADEERYTFRSRFIHRLDSWAFAGDGDGEDGPPFNAAVITRRARAAEVIDWTAFPDPIAHRWRAIDLSESFLTAFASRVPLVGQHPVEITFRGDECEFFVDIDEWPIVSVDAIEDRFFTQLARYSLDGRSPPERATITLPAEL